VVVTAGGSETIRAGRTWDCWAIHALVLTGVVSIPRALWGSTWDRVNTRFRLDLGAIYACWSCRIVNDIQTKIRASIHADSTLQEEAVQAWVAPTVVHVRYAASNGGIHAGGIGCFGAIHTFSTGVWTHKELACRQSCVNASSTDGNGAINTTAAGVLVSTTPCDGWVSAEVRCRRWVVVRCCAVLADSREGIICEVYAICDGGVSALGVCSYRAVNAHGRSIVNICCAFRSGGIRAGWACSPSAVHTFSRDTIVDVGTTGCNGWSVLASTPWCLCAIYAFTSGIIVFISSANRCAAVAASLIWRISFGAVYARS